MFKKPFKIKSNSQLKSSERKIFKDKILQTFGITDAEIEEIIPKKEITNVSKIVTHDNKQVLVYSIQKRPISFEYENVIFPTVYLLWKLPKLVITFTTSDFVASKIYGGADLMLPGVFFDPKVEISFLAQKIASVNTITNQCPIAVGLTTISGNSQSKGQSGKCMVIYHFSGDRLCGINDMPILVTPQMNSPDWVKFSLDDKDEFPALGNGANELLQLTENLDNVSITEELPIAEHIPKEATNLLLVENQPTMDEMLKDCFLTACKYSKTLQLPILTSNFYKSEVIGVCKDGQVLDIKKSSYKKVGEFLKAMQNEGLIKIVEKKKGVDMIEEINITHETFKNFFLDPKDRPVKKSEDTDEREVTKIIESYVVTQAVILIFREFGLKKGDSLQPSEVRKYVTDYVKKNNCQDLNDKRYVIINTPVLSTLCKLDNKITWEDLMQNIFKAMKSCYKIQSNNEESVNKGKPPPIVMSIQKRSANKKVTIVDNLELYNIRIGDFSKECQHGIAASASVSQPSGKTSQQIMIQGNQILFVYKLLTEKYKIPKHYIRGLEFAPKIKK